MKRTIGVFESMSCTLTSSVSSYLTAVGLDRAGWSPQAMAFTLGTAFCFPGGIWLLILSRWRDSGRPLEPAGAVASALEEELEGRVG